MAKNTRDTATVGGSTTAEHTIEDTIDDKKESDAYKLLKDEDLSSSEIDAIEQLLKAKKEKKAKETEGKLLIWKTEVEEYVQKKYGVKLQKIFTARDPNAPTKPGKKSLAGYYKLPSGEEVKYNGFGIRPKKLQDQDLSTLPKRDL